MTIEKPFKTSMFHRLLLVMSVQFCFPCLAHADWPMYQGNAARSAYTKSALPNRMTLRWSFKTANKPTPAWPTHKRINFDNVYQPIVANNTVFFGSSTDDQVYAIDLSTGKVRWRFFTDGPVRFAPVAWNDRIFVTSDDGYLYALAIVDGSLIWKKRGGPREKRILGNDRLISHWPARGGAVVYEDMVYFAAGVWPTDGVYLHALNAQTGKVVWSNVDSGQKPMNHPHGGAFAKSGTSSQGYLVASRDHIVMPTGRSVPAVFNRSNGQLEYFHFAKNQQLGGTRVMLADRFICNSGCLFEESTGQLSQKSGLGTMAATPDGMVRAGDRSLVYSKWVNAKKTDRKGATTTKRELQESKVIPLNYQIRSVIVAGQDAYCGADGQVTGIDYRAQTNTWWSHPIEGSVLGLAAANGCLIASTDQGVVSCFANDVNSVIDNGATIKSTTVETSERSQQLAQAILDKTKVSEGYCVDLGAESGELAFELVKQSDLIVYAVFAKEEQAQAARAKATDAGWYGTRFVAHVGDPATIAYPKYMADLVVSSTLNSGDSSTDDIEAVLKNGRRIQRPHGGQLCLGAVSNLNVETRSGLEGAGEWTHQYSNPANTVNSSDEIVRGPLRMHWYRDVDYEIPNRHGQGPAPLTADGVMVVGGLHGICGLDAYNGRTLWEFEVRNHLADFNGIHHDVGVGDVGSSYCLGGGFAFIRDRSQCSQLELRTGKLVRRFQTPAGQQDKNRNWGYLAFDDGMLFGSVTNDAHRISPRYRGISPRNESVTFFAFNLENGDLAWKYQPEHSIRNNAIAIGKKTVYLVDRVIAKSDHIPNPRRNGRPNPTLKANEHPGGTLLAFDAQTGNEKWRTNKDIFGTQLALSEESNIILMFYQGVRHTFFKISSEVGGRIAAIDASNGKPLWTRDAKYQSHPVINGDVVFAQGGAWNLKTGEDVPFEFNRSYGCGQIASGKHLMVFRSATLGYYDLTRTEGVENFGGIRLGCFINAVPAGGLVLVPDGSSQCTCSYQMQAWFALSGSE